MREPQDGFARWKTPGDRYWIIPPASDIKEEIGPRTWNADAWLPRVEKKVGEGFRRGDKNVWELDKVIRLHSARFSDTELFTPRFYIL